MPDTASTLRPRRLPARGIDGTGSLTATILPAIVERPALGRPAPDPAACISLCWDWVMTMKLDFLIVGGGQAGAKAAEALRADGFEGVICIVCEESELPYLRPPLSKDFLQGKAERESVLVHAQEWYRDNRRRAHAGERGLELDRAHHAIVLADGSRRRYDKLLLCTGSSPRSLTVPGADLEGVHYLRRLDDSERIRAGFAASAQVVMIGGGMDRARDGRSRAGRRPPGHDPRGVIASTARCSRPAGGAGLRGPAP